MKDIILSFVIAILVVTFAGCRQDNKIYEKLEKIDSLIEHKDYSVAYAQLTDMDMTNVTEEKLSAYYNLLMTHALYSLEQPIANDSLINISVAYYEKAKNKEKLAQSLYYKGMLHDNLDNVELAITNLKKAEDIAVSQKYWELLYKLYINFSYINAKAGNNEKALDYARKSLSVSEQMGDMTKKANSLEKLITAFSRIERDDSANVYTERLLCIIPQVDKKSLPSLFSCVGVSYANMKKYHEAEMYVKKSLDYGFNAHTYYILGSIYIAQGKEEEAWNAWMKALNTDAIETKVLVFDYIVEYKKLKGEHKEATRWNDSLLLYQDSLKHIQKTEKTLQIQNEVDMRKQERDSKAQTWTIVVCAGIFIIVLMLSLVCNYRKVAQSKLTMAEMLKQMDDYRKRVAELEASDRDHSLEVEDLRHQLEHLQTIRNELLEHGKQCYGQIVNGGTTTKWNNDDFEAVVEYYSSKYPEKVENIASAYSNLTSYNLFVLLLPEMGIAQDDIPRVLNNTMGAVRTMRSRISRKKKE